MTREEAMEIYKDRSAKFKNTQSIQWKMNYSIWALLALAIYYKPTSLPIFDISNLCSFWLLQPILLVVLIYLHYKFCSKIQESLDFDKNVNDFLIEQLNYNSNKKIKLDYKSIRKVNNNRKWVDLQIGVTIILSVLFCFS